ncbi:hypothetical protein S40285_00642 [Stachybotrys chlorohalonatus IBT 40285]|uniref:Transcription factor Pcc1 n=1 Tax=Stachybotrys chlorohalonatus (strain IBT 40285) TaxID=1283841 RepID=A0A084R2L9_STAC4|nr:hypothetical protein S40285_00642 [Stachybotrys chlorohalonata IBT 40285]
MDIPPDSEFPCSLTLDVPLPTSRLADTALRALQVDRELSPLVWRRLSIENAPDPADPEDARVLQVMYKATTNRMLRVAVNSFMDSLKLVLEVMEQLDVDVLAAAQDSAPTS